MATVKLADVIDVEIYQGIKPEDNPEQTIFFESGVVVRSPDLDAKANVPSSLVEMPFWRDLSPADEPNYSSDGDTSSTPKKIVQGKMTARRAHLNQSWAARDLTTEFTMGDEPMTRIRNRTGRYWQWQWQRRLVAILRGIYNANVAGNIDAGFGDAGDMVHSISVDNGANITAATRFNYEAFIDARFTMGERVDELNVLLIHPTIHARLLKENAIDFVKESNNEKIIQIYAGHRVITSERCPVWAVGTNTGFHYVSTVFGPAAFGYGEGTPDTPVEIDRDPAIGNGAGEEVLYERKTWIIHPFGHSNLNATNNGGGGISQNLSDCALAANWKRNFFRQNVPIAFFVHN
jgi:hypothetical protein